MARAAKPAIWIALACIAAPALAASPVAAAERIAMAGFHAAKPGPVRMVAPVAKSQSRRAAPAPADDGYETLQRPSTTYRPRRLGKSLRVDLARLQVTRPAAGERPAYPAGWTVPRIVHIGVKQGVMSGPKAVRVEMPVAPYLALESRVGPDGEGDMALRFRLRY